ncbi:MAG: S8 family peptidase [Crocinitomicaceae bacterium]|nr:S8 family peptidase [Crocinitomicaceae bacterium]
MAGLLKDVIFIGISIVLSISASAQKFGFKEVLEKSPNRLTTFCVPNNDQNVSLIENHGLTIKYSTQEWCFISATPQWIDETSKSGDLTNYYFELAPPALLADSARMHHHIDEVHAGTGGLTSSYTGANVIIGFVDTGIDFNHPDFKEANGDTRVLRYWDQSMPDTPSSPAPYGYGYVWDSADINNLVITSMDNSAHGSTVSGQASGNGLANGTNKGMAPDSKIIVVETDFSRPNWTLTVADACDYIFSVADSLGMPAVVNLSLGTYLGSHDGNDPASEAIEALLDNKKGRIVVSAAGNSGGIGPYHQHSDVTSDTNFVWFANNPSGSLGANTIFFDLWTDNSNATFDFALGADTEAPSYNFRGRTSFHGASSSIGTAIFDTIWNGSNRIATVEIYTNIFGGNYNMQVLAYIDSTDYRYRFETTGTGSYDLWSGAGLGYNNMFDSAPTLAEFPDSALYVAPDLNQTIVSSWNCSEKVVSVGNFRNRIGHVDLDGNNYYNPATPVGELSPASSKGPNRNNLIKPNVAASGDVSLAAAPEWFLTNPGNSTAVDSGGWHARNGGTSMASPIVAGIAALYLERCNRATYSNFLNDLQGQAYTDAFTGATPNNGYGYGKPHALNTLLDQNLAIAPIITPDYGTGILTSSSSSFYQWYLNGDSIPAANSQNYEPSSPYGSYTVEIINNDGCSALSSPFIITLGLEDSELQLINTFPNPSNELIQFETDVQITNVLATSINGKIFELKLVQENTYSLEDLSSGNYILTIESTKGTFHSKIIRL